MQLTKRSKLQEKSFFLKYIQLVQKIQTLGHLRFVKYQGQVKGKHLKAGTGFDLRTLPPTSDASKYHIYRTYYEVQMCLDNVGAISPLEWGWTRDSQSGNLIPHIKDQAAAPDKVLKMISCGCKQRCSRNCK